MTNKLIHNKTGNCNYLDKPDYLKLLVISHHGIKGLRNLDANLLVPLYLLGIYSEISSGCLKLQTLCMY